MTKKLSRILYCEDEPDIQEVARLSLEVVGGFTVLIASSGAEAVAQAEAFNPDLLLLDVMMPGLDGPATLAALRKIPALAKTPAVFMTAKVQRNEIERFLALGALEVVPKPFDPMTLPATLEGIWNRAQGA
ncbi:MAG: response regulator [Alphaproteobacteria bacterium]|nr:response regulator [Alphaproteobacteria bacterium]